MPFLELKNISKSYNGKSILHNINISIDLSDFVSLLGKSGSGKTTLLRIIAGLEHPDEGTILLNGTNITAINPQKRNFGFVFQNYALFPHMSVYDNIAYGLKIKKEKKEKIERKIDDLLKKVRLSGKEKLNVCQLSGGEQQRVALARAIITEPPVLLLDEPLSNLDHSLRLQTRNEIKRLQNDLGITTIYVTHDQSEALSLSNKVSVMNNGVLIQTASPQDVYNNPTDLFVADFVGHYNIFNPREYWELFQTTVSDQGSIAILPEHLVLCKTDKQTSIYIEDILFTGTHTEYIINARQHFFKSISFAGNSGSFRKGEEVSISAATENIRVISCSS